MDSCPETSPSTSLADAVHVTSSEMYTGSGVNEIESMVGFVLIMETDCVEVTNEPFESVAVTTQSNVS